MSVSSVESLIQVPYDVILSYKAVVDADCVRFLDAYEAQVALQAVIDQALGIKAAHLALTEVELNSASA